VTKVRNLTHTAARARARLLDVRFYDITIDLTDGSGSPGDGVFRTVTAIAFDCAEAGASTVVDLAAHAVDSAVLNGRSVDISGWSPEKGLSLTGLTEHNRLVIEATFEYSTSGQGLHRVLDPADQEVYLYSNFEPSSAQRVYACFDQPDLKSIFTWHVTAPAHWTVVSNAPIERIEEDGLTQIVHFVESARMSTSVTAICAGPYHQVRQTYDGIDLGLFVRRSMAPYLDPDELFLITRQGLDFFHKHFGVRYPLPKYDQLFVPEFNMGAMENFGCVTFSEQRYIFRSPATHVEYEQRASTILHELAHMWFGNLVTIRWWNDLWLKEAFAEWASHWAAAEVTQFADAWTPFLSVRKRWAYGQDQLSSTHPVYQAIEDVAAVGVNFDGITYYKGASIIKQLVAHIGIDALTQGLRQYFTKHAWGNATLYDLLVALSSASGRELTGYASQWLSTAHLNTLRPLVDTAADGSYAHVSVEQTAPASHPTLRRHRIGVGLYDLTGSRLVRRELRYVEIFGARTELPELTGITAADVLLLNDDDHGYVKLRFDPGSLATILDHLGGLESSLARALCWAAVWDMVYDAELPSRDMIGLIGSSLPAETDLSVTTATLAQADTAIAMYTDEAWQANGWSVLTSTARKALADAPPGSGFQLSWARAFASAARTDEELGVVRGWLDGLDLPPGLSPVGDLRWHLIHVLSAAGKIGTDRIASEHGADRTTAGDQHAAAALALQPTAEAKAAAWAELTDSAQIPNWRRRALLHGFYHPSQLAVTQPYVSRFFEAAAKVWAEHDSDAAREFVQLGYPRLHISPTAVSLADDWLAEAGRPAPLRRLIAEGRDTAARAVAARRRDRTRPVPKLYPRPAE